MKILVFEYITGGGLSKEDLPESLLREGVLMLEALLNDLAVLASVQITVLLDFRVTLLDLPGKIKVVQLASKQSAYDLLPGLVGDSDLVWPIAPEMNLELQKISELVEVRKKQLLNSSLEAVTLCGDKLLTYQLLHDNGIAAVETNAFTKISPRFPGKWVVKPKDGVGCINSYLFSEKVLFEKLMLRIEKKSDYIFQPYVKGESLSLSCIFKEGLAWLLCCNRQKISKERGGFKLIACEVNVKTEGRLEVYQYLASQIANAIPGLWGYVGIDIIQPKGGKPLVLDINPRLTTSYAGIYQATGLNVAKSVVDMVGDYPQFSKIQGKAITVII